MAPGGGMNVTAIPLELRELPRWVVWRWGVDPKTGKREEAALLPAPTPAATREQPEPRRLVDRSSRRARVVEAGKADGIGFVARAPVCRRRPRPRAPRSRPGGHHARARQLQRAIRLRHRPPRCREGRAQRSRPSPGRHRRLPGRPVLLLLGRARRRDARPRSRSGRRSSTRCSSTSSRSPSRTSARVQSSAASTSTTASSSTGRWRPATARQFRRPVGRPLGHAATTLGPRPTSRSARPSRSGPETTPDASTSSSARSGLYRDKWERDDYREKTIQNASRRPPLRPLRDAVRQGASLEGRSRDAPWNPPAADVESAGASLRPDVVGTQDGTHPLKPPSVDVEEPPLVAVEAAAFAAVDEASAEPLLGDEAGTILAAGGSAVWYGDGGAGKTTLGLDQALHLCAGRDWLGLPVPAPLLRVLDRERGAAREVPGEAAAQAGRLGWAGARRAACTCSRRRGRCSLSPTSGIVTSWSR